MPKSFHRSVVLSTILVGAPLSANTLSLEPAKDNTLFQDPGGLISNGSGPGMYVGMNNLSTIRRGLIQFDFTSIPLDSTITSAALTLNVSQSQGATLEVGLHRVTQAWGEGTSNSGLPGGQGAPAQPGDATWLHTFFDSGTWAAPGGDFAAAPSATAPPGSFGSFTVASTPQFVADIQGWIGSAGTNFGWLIRGLESGGNALRIDTRENATAANRPRLSVSFTPATRTWTTDLDGNWGDSGNWSTSVPDAAGVIAMLGPAITAPRTVTLGTGRTVGELNFQSAQAYSVAGATLSIQGLGASGAVRSLAGSHTISAPLAVPSDTELHVAAANDTLSLSGGIFAQPSAALTKTGSGAVVVPNIRARALAVTGGVVRAATNGSSAGTSRVSALSIANGSFDLRDNDLIIDYDGENQTAAIRSMLIDGRLASSSATAQTKLGYTDNSIANLTAFSGQTVDSTSVLVKFTYSGDANLDGQVDINDLAALATSWQTNGVWTNGDFDYSGLVDINDLAALATNWQAGVGAPLSQSFDEAAGLFNLPTSIPEPGVLVALAGGALFQRRRRVN